MNRDVEHDVLPKVAREKLSLMSARADEIERLLADPEVSSDFRRSRELSVERSAIEPAVRAFREFLAYENEASDLRAAIDGDDREFAAMAREELPIIEDRLTHAARIAIESLVSGDDSKVASVMLELRAGVGGDEAALWTAELLAMYEQFARRRGWRTEVLEVDEALGVSGGVKSAVLSVSGDGAWGALEFEAGTHCVKRVPATEAQGRIHTSTSTVAVLPEPEEVDLKIDPADVDENITTAQGPGGQNVNKVATAVRLFHRPSGVEVRMQESKSQRQNREKAWRLLRARLFEIEREKAARARNEARASQIGEGGRAERIRTYRFKESIAVDHRLERSFNLNELLSGALDEVAEGLRKLETERRIAAL